jgi:hypothetical protein
LAGVRYGVWAMDSHAGYEVRSPSRRWSVAAKSIWPSLLFALISGVGLYLSTHDNQFARGFGLTGICGIAVVTAVIQLVRAEWNGTAELVVERPGVRLGEVAVPWAWLWHIVVTPDGGAGQPRVALRLRPGAPVPHGLSYVVHDPAQPLAAHATSLLSSPLDRSRLIAAVRALGPPEVHVVTEDAPPVWQPPAQFDKQARRDTTGIVTEVRLREGKVKLQVELPSLRGGTQYQRVKPYPVVLFTLPDGRQFGVQTSHPAQGQPGQQVVVDYAVANPADARVRGRPPKAQWTPVTDDDGGVTFTS